MTPLKQPYHLILLCMPLTPSYPSQSKFQNSDSSFFFFLISRSGMLLNQSHFFVFSTAFTLWYLWEVCPHTCNRILLNSFLVDSSVMNKIVLHHTHTSYFPFSLYFIHHCTYNQWIYCILSLYSALFKAKCDIQEAKDLVGFIHCHLLNT